jgi:predicted peptidase
MKLRTLALLLFFAVGTFFAQDKPQDKIVSPKSFEYRPKPVGLKYLEFLPKGYEAKGEKKWPMILFLHGAGERGTNVWRVNIHGPAKYAAAHPEFPFVLISPLCSADTAWSDDALLALLDQVQASHKIDTNRVYLTGLSMGGFGTWSLGMKHPERFAAIAPICGGGDSIYVILAAKGYLKETWPYLKTLPIWVFHGAKDTVVPIAESEHMVKTLEASGVDMSKVKFTIYPEAQHDAWSETYSNPELYDWFLKQERK